MLCFLRVLHYSTRIETRFRLGDRHAQSVCVPYGARGLKPTDDNFDYNRDYNEERRPYYGRRSSFPAFSAFSNNSKNCIYSMKHAARHAGSARVVRARRNPPAAVRLSAVLLGDNLVISDDNGCYRWR